jgi:hypothetical protein
MSKDNQIVGYWVNTVLDRPGIRRYLGQVHLDCYKEGKKRGLIKQHHIIGPVTWRGVQQGDALCEFCRKKFNQHYRPLIVGYGVRELDKDGREEDHTYCMDCVTPEIIIAFHNGLTPFGRDDDYCSYLGWPHNQLRCDEVCYKCGKEL